MDNRGVGIEIPVKVHFPGSLTNVAKPLKSLLDFGKAEHVIKKQCEEYAYKKQDVAPGTLRCTAGGDGRDDELKEGQCRWEKALGRLLMRIFDNTFRPADLANTTYHFENTGHDSDPLQLGVLEVYCSDDMTPKDEFAAMCSALVLNQMTRQILLSLDESPTDPVERAFWWKWMAYALFSKRAHECSAFKSLEVLVDRMCTADIEAFSTVLTSDHPEEELCSRPPGKIDERGAILSAGTAIRWEFDNNGQAIIKSRVITLPSPIRAVRTFSDDGKSD